MIYGFFWFLGLLKGVRSL